MKKYLASGLFLAVSSFILNAYGNENLLQQRLQRESEYFKSKGPSTNDNTREEFIDIDIKRVIFPHKKHQTLIKEIGASCNICHHKKKEKQNPRACKKCHTNQAVVSTGKYTQAGKKLKRKDVFHLLCRNCHKKMFLDGYRRLDGSPAVIPLKCHHCHLKKK